MFCRASELISFGPLAAAFSYDGFFYDDAVSVFQEDIKQPGTFLFDHFGSALLRFTPETGNTTLVCGSTKEQGNVGSGEGQATEARFYLILDIAQINDSILIADFAAGCIKRYNVNTGYVSTYIGQCNDASTEDRWLLPEKLQKGPVDASLNFLDAPTSIIPVNNGEYFMITVFGEDFIYRFNPETHTIVSLSPKWGLEKDLPNYRGLLLNTENTIFYTYCVYGLSSFNLTSFEAFHLIAENVYDSHLAAPTDMIPGSFFSGVLVRTTFLAWLIPDKLMIATADEEKDALVVIDLENEEFFYLCIGKIISLLLFYFLFPWSHSCESVKWTVLLIGCYACVCAF